ncbi:cofilin [Dissophora globulifera]|nr:cofilin [Dissophora globulifera]
MGGIDIPDDVLRAFTTFVATHPVTDTTTKPKYLIIRMTDDFLSCAIESIATLGSTYTDMVSQLSPTHCRWIIYSLDADDDIQVPERTLCFMTWSPDDAPVKQKMLYSASKGFFRRGLPGGIDMFLVQAASPDEIALNVVVERVIEKQSPQQ